MGLEFLGADSWVIWLILVGAIVFLVIKIMKKKSLSQLDQEQLKYMKADAGKIELEKATKEYLLSLIKIGKKDGGFFSRRKLYVGSIKIGSIEKIGKLDQYIIYLIKTSFFQFNDKSKIFFQVNLDEITFQDNKGIYLNDNSIIILKGIYTLQNKIKDKEGILSSIIDKTINEDLLGRIRNMGGSVVYYNLHHSQEADIAEKKIEAYKEADNQRMRKIL